MHNHADGTVQRARKLRREMSLPEALLWRVLKTRPMGVKFRHQHPLEEFVVDFYCHAARTVIEIDGIAHDMGIQPTYDRQRDATLSAAGFDVVRIPAQDVLNDPEVVAEAVVAHCLSAATSIRVIY